MRRTHPPRPLVGLERGADLLDQFLERLDGQAHESPERLAGLDQLLAVGSHDGLEWVGGVIAGEFCFRM